jgi:hypothetical protein
MRSCGDATVSGEDTDAILVALERCKGCRKFATGVLQLEKAFTTDTANM